MSGMDEILAGLAEDEDLEEKPKASKAVARRPRRVSTAAAKGRPPAAERAATSVQHGKRADADYTQVNASIRKELKPSLFFYLKQEGTSLSEVIETFLEDYVAKRGGIIGGARRKK